MVIPCFLLLVVFFSCVSVVVLFFPNSAASKLLDLMYQTRTKHSKYFKHITTNTLLAHFATCKRTIMCSLTHLSILARREPIWMPLVHSAWSSPDVKELVMFFPSTSKAASCKVGSSCYKGKQANFGILHMFTIVRIF